MKNKLLILTTCFVMLMSTFTFANPSVYPDLPIVPNNPYYFIYVDKYGGTNDIMVVLKQHNLRLAANSNGYTITANGYHYRLDLDSFDWIPAGSGGRTITGTNYSWASSFSRLDEIYLHSNAPVGASDHEISPIPANFPLPHLMEMVQEVGIMGVIPIQIFPILAGLMVGLVAFRKAYQLLVQQLRGA